MHGRIIEQGLKLKDVAMTLVAITFEGQLQLIIEISKSEDFYSGGFFCQYPVHHLLLIKISMSDFKRQQLITKNNQ